MACDEKSKVGSENPARAEAWTEHPDEGVVRTNPHIRYDSSLPLHSAAAGEMHGSFASLRMTNQFCVAGLRTQLYTVFTVGIELAMGSPSGAKARISGVVGGTAEAVPYPKLFGRPSFSATLDSRGARRARVRTQ